LGYNEDGQLGDGTDTDSNTPVMVSDSGGYVNSGSEIIAISAGGFHSMALASGGEVFTWGRNFYGQLGNGTTGTDSNTPVEVVDE
jgi:alpha-tubulin suppressor-like RCC1 family protein